MAKTTSNTRKLNLRYEKSTKGTHVFKQDENEGRHVLYFERSLFAGEPPANINVTVEWK